MEFWRIENKIRKFLGLPLPLRIFVKANGKWKYLGKL